MCNLYSFTKGQAAIREAARAMVGRTGPTWEGRPDGPQLDPDIQQ